MNIMQNKCINISCMNLPPPLLVNSLVAELYEERSWKFHPRNKTRRVNKLFNKNIFERLVSSLGIAKSTEYSGLSLFGRCLIQNLGHNTGYTDSEFSCLSPLPQNYIYFHNYWHRYINYEEFRNIEILKSILGMWLW